MKRWLAPLALAVGLAAGAGSAVAAPNPPGPVDPTAFPLDCPGFQVTAELTGKAKLINLPGGRQKITAPGQKVTLTGPSGTTVSYVITGTTHIQNLPRGVQEIRSTGRNVITVPRVLGPNGHPEGLFLTTGNVNYALQNGKELRLFSGPGKVTDVCALLAP